MTDAEPDVHEALASVAVALGTATAYFAPADERRLDPISVALGLGGVLLLRYLKGFEAKAGEQAEAAGRDSGCRLAFI